MQVPTIPSLPSIGDVTTPSAATKAQPAPPATDLPAAPAYNQEAVPEAVTAPAAQAAETPVPEKAPEKPKQRRKRKPKAEATPTPKTLLEQATELYERILELTAEYEHLQQRLHSQAQLREATPGTFVRHGEDLGSIVTNDPENERAIVLVKAGTLEACTKFIPYEELLVE